MSNQTLQRAPKQRTRGAQSVREASAKATRANAAKRSRVKQTARIEGLRDGKPLIFGWGRHLTRAQKARYQRTAAWTFMGVVAFAVVATLIFGVLNEQIFIPNQSVVKVNGVGISQDAYRKELAYQAQLLWNPLQQEITQHNALQTKVNNGDATATAQDNTILTQLQTNEANYAQAQITQATINTLIENQLILNGEKQIEQQKHVPASTFEPTQQEVNSALASFKKGFPSGETYASFLSSNNLSNSDVLNAITMQLRRDKMQAYLAKQLVSPTPQVEIRKIEVDTKANAASIRSQLVKAGLTDAIWTSLAKSKSLDPNAKDNGGNLGWVPPGTGDSAIELWAYAAGRKVGDLSPVLADTSGTYDIVQVTGIDPSRTVDANTLQSAQDNALSHWLSGQRAAPANTVGSPDSTMLNAARNLPKTPSLSATLPSITPPPGSGLPGSGLPGGSIPATGTGG